MSSSAGVGDENRSLNAVPFLVVDIGDAVVCDHRSPRLGHAAENVEAGTEGAGDLAVALSSPTHVVRARLARREHHRGVIRRIADAHAAPGECGAFDLTGGVEDPALGV